MMRERYVRNREEPKCFICQAKTGMAIWYMVTGFGAIIQILMCAAAKDFNNCVNGGCDRDAKEQAYNIQIALACFTFLTAMVAVYSVMNKKAEGCLCAMGLELISLIVGIVYVVKVKESRAFENVALVWGIIVLFFHIYIIYVWYSLYDYFKSEDDVEAVPENNYRVNAPINPVPSQNAGTHVIVVQPQQYQQPQPYLQQQYQVQPQSYVQQPQPYVQPQANYQVNI